MIATIATIAGIPGKKERKKNVQQQFWLNGNHNSAIVAITTFHNDRWRVVSMCSQPSAERFFQRSYGNQLQATISILRWAAPQR